jgi:hypothetical protein
MIAIDTALTDTKSVTIFVNMNDTQVKKTGYINTLQDRIADVNGHVKAADNAVGELLEYLGSAKFYNDPMVNKTDIYLRLEPIRSALLSAKYAAQVKETA